MRTKVKKTAKKSPHSTPAPLAKIRKEISSVDAQIAQLCKKRLRLTNQVFIYKRKNNLDLVDSKQEKTVFAAYIKTLCLETSVQRIHQLTSAVIGLSPTYPAKK